MTLDRPSDGADGPGEVRREQGLQHRGDVPAAQAELAEPRNRAEYCESLRGDEGRSARAGDNQHETGDPRTDRSGWDALDAEARPSLDAVRVSPERITHILDGDSTGGGHRHGVGKPNKTEFPLSWDDKKIMNNVIDVARLPDSPPVHQHRNDRWLCSGIRDRVEVSVILLRNGEVWTAWPEEGGPGVVRNPRRENHDRR